jgi:hypothetical protein
VGSGRHCHQHGQTLGGGPHTVPAKNPGG